MHWGPKHFKLTLWKKCLQNSVITPKTWPIFVRVWSIRPITFVKSRRAAPWHRRLDLWKSLVYTLYGSGSVHTREVELLWLHWEAFIGMIGAPPPTLCPDFIPPASWVQSYSDSEEQGRRGRCVYQEATTDQNQKNRNDRSCCESPEFELNIENTSNQRQSRTGHTHSHPYCITTCDWVSAAGSAGPEGEVIAEEGGGGGAEGGAEGGPRLGETCRWGGVC